jgi:type I restriction enzyme S subunit
VISGEDFDAPEGWTKSTLGLAARLVKSKVDPKVVPAETPYVGLEHIEAHSMKLLGHGQATDIKSTKTRFMAGDVLYGKLRPYLNKVGRPDFDGICSTDFLVFEESEALDSGFLAYYLNQLWIADRAHHLSNGVELPRIDWKSLGQFPIAYPASKDRQRAIVNAVKNAADLRSSAASHLAATRRAIERFRYAVKAAACSGRLTATWREANPQPSVRPGPALSKQAQANSSGAPNTNDLVEVPDTWAWWPIEGMTECVIDYRGRTPPSQSSGPIPHVRTTQIRNGRIDWNTDRFVDSAVYDKYMTRGIPQLGDVLFTMEAPMGEVGIVNRGEPFSIAQRILLLRPGSDVSGEFLCLALRFHAARRAIEYRATGSGVLGIAYKRLRSVVLPKPPMKEQLEIVTRASRLLTLADQLQRCLETASASIEHSSQAVLAKAFRGDLIPEDINR